MVFKKMKWVISIAILLIISVILYKHSDNFEFGAVKISGFDKPDKNKSLNPLRNSKVVITDIHMGIGDDTSVGIELACPYTSSKQYSQLWKHANQIKSDFLFQVGSNQMRIWTKEKNYGAVKAAFRTIVNKYVDEPVKEVYLSKFFIE